MEMDSAQSTVPLALVREIRTITIYREFLPSNHQDLAMVYNNFSVIHQTMRIHPQAISYHEKASAIRQCIPSLSHSDLALLYNSIGAVHEAMKSYSKTYVFYESAVVAAQKLLPADHRNFQNWKKNFERIRQIKSWDK